MPHGWISPEAEALHRVAGAGGVVEGGAEVVELRLHGAQPVRHGHGPEPVPGPLGEVEVPVEVAVPGGLHLGGVHEGLDRELPDGLEQSEPGAPGGVDVGDHERLVHESGDEVDDGVGMDVVAGAHRLHGVEAATAGEHAEAPEHLLLLGAEVVVAPRDGGPQGPVAVGGVG